ncbi:polyketide cyclase/dehydrase/lipid transport protein [Kineococcus rhizosphaerae]|uniref:Polyketide cyclase/dehydrase/lipid transport protein n=1 Tax=Kineococcus rhizosphaerae TaxID=559628 RepID=A0A2T0R1W4_9ACTN|nr:polyketide cyclase/dehydrase/lipid transport protein [Kineococcus rhizosphaerae]
MVRQVLPVPAAVAFDVVHDYPGRLRWDTLLREAFTVGGAAPARGVEAVCRARWTLGGLTFRTRYVTFRRPELAAVTLTSRSPFFAAWAASMRHRDLGDGRSEVVYTLTFTGAPAPLARLVEPVAVRVFRWETGRRLRALAHHLDAR